TAVAAAGIAARGSADRSQRAAGCGRALSCGTARRSQARSPRTAQQSLWTSTPSGTAAARQGLMRIVGGRLRGRPLGGPKSSAIRPTADRLRESLFNILVHAHGDPITGARVLDLFAGTGALGIEALSRGAAFALFVDDGAHARALIREN